MSATGFDEVRAECVNLVGPKGELPNDRRPGTPIPGCQRHGHNALESIHRYNSSGTEALEAFQVVAIDVLHHGEQRGGRAARLLQRHC